MTGLIKFQHITLNEVKHNTEVKALLEAAERHMKVKGYTEHSYRHVTLVSKTAGRVLKELGADEREIELAEIAGYLHDIGNSINRVDHAHTGAILAYTILKDMGMGYDEAVEVMLAIGNHDENSGTSVSKISAALILADKSDVHRTRVNNGDFSTFDIHDRVNYAVQSSELILDVKNKTVRLQLEIDTKICPVMDYFEIFLVRMTMNRRAADFLGLTFQLVINDSVLL
ncbi:MAG: HD domain-containing protein [Eubacteriales bacterium]|nr:HD domain-containing protein [Eubacteriales bacterium]